MYGYALYRYGYHEKCGYYVVWLLYIYIGMLRMDNDHEQLPTTNNEIDAAVGATQLQSEQS